MSIDSLRARFRLEIQDKPTPFVDSQTSDGTTTVYGLTVEKVDTTSPFLVVVSPPGTALLPGEYTLDAENGVITLTAPVVQGSVLTITGYHFEAFTAEDVDIFLATALEQHTHGRVDTTGAVYTYDTVPVVEEYLVVLLAVIEALWALATEAAQQIDIHDPEGIMIPASQRYQQLITEAARREVQYDSLAAELNVGLGRIQVLNLRRVSRTTNRLVPIYVPKEFDDTTYPPVRVYPPIEPGIL